MTGDTPPSSLVIGLCSRGVPAAVRGGLLAGAPDDCVVGGLAAGHVHGGDAGVVGQRAAESPSPVTISTTPSSDERREDPVEQRLQRVGDRIQLEHDRTVRDEQLLQGVQRRHGEDVARPRARAPRRRCGPGRAARGRHARAPRSDAGPVHTSVRNPLNNNRSKVPCGRPRRTPGCRGRRRSGSRRGRRHRCRVSPVSSEPRSTSQHRPGSADPLFADERRAPVGL